MSVKSLAAFILIACMWLTSSCADERKARGLTGVPPHAVGSRAAPGAVRVVTSIVPVYDLAKNIGGDHALVHNLLPPGRSPHTYEPAPDDSRALEEAHIVFRLGLKLDDWMDRIASGMPAGRCRMVEVSAGVTTLSGEGGHGVVDPHVWMDPLRMKEMAGNVRDEFIRVLPEKKDVFEGNYARYARQLEELDRKYRETLGNFRRKDFVTFHSFLNYQAERYGINPVATIAEFPGKEPDPHALARVIDLLREKKVKIVFVEPQFSPRASNTIAEEIDGTVMVIDPIGSPADPKRDSYVKNMEENLNTMEHAFRLQN